MSSLACCFFFKWNLVPFQGLHLNMSFPDCLCIQNYYAVTTELLHSWKGRKKKGKKKGKGLIAIYLEGVANIPSILVPTLGMLRSMLNYLRYSQT